MTNPPLLLTMIVMQQGLLALMWVGAAQVGLSRAAALHFAGGAAMSALSMALVSQRGQMAEWLGLGVANVAGVAAVLLIRRGVQLFCKLEPSDRDTLVWLAGGAAALALTLQFELGLPWLVLITAVLLAWPLWRAAREVSQHLRFEFGPALARWLALPMALVAAGLMLRGLGAPLFTHSVGVPTYSQTGFNASFGLFLLTAMLMLHLTLAAMVVLRLVRQLQHISAHDPLTATLNRRGFDDALARESERLRRYREPFAVLSIDIDHFKSINDRFGHSVGDDVLVAVARCIGLALRDVDRVGRIGGEEFCVLLPHTDAEAAHAVAERLLGAVREQCAGPAAAPWRVTVSIGVAVAADAQESAAALLQRLDRALYRAKAEGRDRVRLAESRSGAPQWAAG